MIIFNLPLKNLIGPHPVLVGGEWGGGGGGWLCEGSRDILKIQLLYLGFSVMCFVFPTRTVNFIKSHVFDIF